MAAVPKAPKEKPLNGAPKLVPRQTAASAARAARIATNRNLAPPPTQLRQSPPPIAKLKKRNPLKSDSKTSIKECNQDFVDESPRSDEGVMDPDYQDPDIFQDIPPAEASQFQQASPIEPDFTGPKIVEIIEDKPPESDESRCRPSSPRSVQSSRPTTPRVSSSHPTTPRGSSRPNTPRGSSRPNTPQVSSASRNNTPRPTTPSNPSNSMRSSASSRPTTPRISMQSPTTRSKSPDSSNYLINPSLKQKEDANIKSVFATKQKQFLRLKKELDLKQQEVLLMFDSLRQVRERMADEGDSGAGEGQVEEELVMFNVANWTAADIAQMLKDTSPSEEALDFVKNIGKIDENDIEELDMKAMSVPASFADLCLKAIVARDEVLDWVKELVSQNEDNAGIERITRYNSEGLQLCEVLKDMKLQATVTVNSLIQLSRQACQERAALIAIGQTLIRELAKLREDLKIRHAAIEEKQENALAKQLSETRQELEEERNSQKGIKDKLASTEQLYRQTRARVAKMDKQLREAEASIVNLTSTVKTLEDQSRQKEVQLEARARKLRDSLKSGEYNSQQIAQQRDAFQAEAAQLKENIEKLVAEHKDQINDLNNKLKEYNISLGDQIKNTEKEMESKLIAESALEESQREIEQLKAKVTELINSRPNPDLPTEKEMDLRAELEATKDTLRMTEDEVTACKQEKVRFLETLTKIAENDNKVGMQQKLAAELLSKEEILCKMQIQIREMSKTIKLNEQKLLQYEQYVHSIQEFNKTVQNEPEDQQGYHYQELQQEIMSLKMNLLEVVHRNDELSELLAQKDQQLDHQEKTSRAQARVIKVREELINMLKNKESEQSQELSTLQQDLEHRMRVVDEVNKQIAGKADKIQELFSTLESKQQQIHRLEKIVLALEEQHRRAQAQRTRHEEKIAALEHELASLGSRRERKFIFF